MATKTEEKKEEKKKDPRAGTVRYPASGYYGGSGGTSFSDDGAKSYILQTLKWWTYNNPFGKVQICKIEFDFTNGTIITHGTVLGSSTSSTWSLGSTEYISGFTISYDSTCVYGMQFTTNLSNTSPWIGSNPTGSSTASSSTSSPLRYRYITGNANTYIDNLVFFFQDLSLCPYSHGRELTKPTFVKVDKLGPGSRGVNLVVKVDNVKTVLERKRSDGSTLTIAEAVVGDSTASILLTARNDQISLLKKGSTVVLRNCKVEMFKSHMRLTVDKWGKIDTSTPLDEEINLGENLSDTEYELVREEE